MVDRVHAAVLGPEARAATPNRHRASSLDTGQELLRDQVAELRPVLAVRRRALLRDGITGLGFCLAALLLLPSSATSAELAGVASVIDGDTLEVRGTRVRLFGIDAPESRQTCTLDDRSYRCGQQAALALADKIGRRPVTCARRDTDRYGRLVAVCRLGRVDLNGWLVREGWALAYRAYSTAYADEEAAAQRARRGLWRGSFTPPWEWRKQQRTSKDASAGRTSWEALVKDFYEYLESELGG
jgi:endonuclease YncB( thermonuclease family)